MERYPLPSKKWQWRMLPCNFPKWQLVYYYYSKWPDLEHFDLLLSKLTERVRLNKGQNAQASLGIIDSQSVRWGNNRSLNGFDGNKKVKGIKRHIVVDKNGFLLAINENVEIFFMSYQSYSSRWRVQRRNYLTGQKQIWIHYSSRDAL